MRETNVFEVEDHKLFALGTNINSFLTTDGVRVGVPAVETDAAALLHTAFGLTLAVIDGGNPGPVDYKKNEAARETMKNAYRALVSHRLRYNELVTDANLTEIGLPIWKKTRVRKVKPLTHPEGELVNGGPGQLKGRFHDEGSSMVGIPATADSMEVCIEYDGDGGIHTWNEIFHHARPEFSLPPEFCNRKCRARARWLCDNGEKGLWSDSFEVAAVLLDDWGKPAAAP
ncbi:hypothetical protein FACS189491_08830 [Spirochaetia bacterium]|nr:hypothetical protein FACS189491_08830 [Spirochaetia bacterium]